jgi:hypothetical protein
MMIFMRKAVFVFVSAWWAAAQQPQAPRDTPFEGQKAVVLANQKIAVTLLEQGSTIANVVLVDDPEKLNPLWNPVQLARNAGRTAQFNGTIGHFVCVDGFGTPSAEERAAGLPGHGEAHLQHFEVTREPSGRAVTFSGKLPIVEEVFTRTFHIVDGESVVYVDSRIESLLGFDRPVNWAEHATVGAPFLEPGKTTIALSGTRSQNRDYTATNQAGRGRGGTLGANPNSGRGGAPATQRRLVPGKDFTWPMAGALDGSTVDLHVIPENPHFLDHAATLLDPTRELEWVAAFNSEKRLIYGYVFRRADYPWLQHWGNYPSAGQVVRGMEFSTQPYDVSRREAISRNAMFGAPTYRWLPAKSKIESHFLLFYARVPEGFTQIDDVRLEDGHLTIEDRSAGKQLTLAASRGL